MVYKGIVKDGRVELPPDANLPDGTEVSIEPAPSKGTVGDLRKFFGKWQGDDADEVLKDIYATRSSAPPRAGFDADDAPA